MIGVDNCQSFADGSGACFLPFPCYRCGVLDDAGDVCEHERGVAGDL